MLKKNYSDVKIIRKIIFKTIVIRVSHWGTVGSILNATKAAGNYGQLGE